MRTERLRRASRPLEVAEGARFSAKTPGAEPHSISPVQFSNSREHLAKGGLRMSGIFLRLAPMPISMGPPSALLAATPDAAIVALESGFVVHLSVAEEWGECCDPSGRVRRFYDSALRAGKTLPEWRVEDFRTLISHPEAIARSVLERVSQPTYETPQVFGHPALSPRWRFDNFTVSPSNENAFAFATLASLENRPERTPLMLFGPAGSGKSHLLHAIGHQWLRFNRDSGRLLLLSAGQFMADEAVGVHLSALRNGDCLLFDDLEALKSSDQIHLSNLLRGTIGDEVGLIFCWRGERSGVARFACSHFAEFQNLCLVELHGC